MARELLDGIPDVVSNLPVTKEVYEKAVPGVTRENDLFKKRKSNGENGMVIGKRTHSSGSYHVDICESYSADNCVLCTASNCPVKLKINPN